MQSKLWVHSEIGISNFIPSSLLQ